MIDTHFAEAASACDRAAGKTRRNEVLIHLMSALEALARGRHAINGSTAKAMTAADRAASARIAVRMAIAAPTARDMRILAHDAGEACALAARWIRDNY